VHCTFDGGFGTRVTKKSQLTLAQNAQMALDRANAARPASTCQPRVAPTEAASVGLSVVAPLLDVRFGRPEPEPEASTDAERGELVDRAIAGDLEAAETLWVHREPDWWLDELLPESARELSDAWSHDRHTSSEVIGALNLIFVLAQTMRRRLLVDEGRCRGTVLLTAPVPRGPVAAAAQTVAVALWESTLERHGYEVRICATLSTPPPCLVAVGWIARGEGPSRQELTALPTDNFFLAPIGSEPVDDLDLPAFRLPRHSLRWLEHRAASRSPSAA